VGVENILSGADRGELKAHFGAMTVDELKMRLGVLAPAKPKVLRKELLIDSLMSELNAATLMSFYESLSGLEQAALQEALHHTRGKFDYRRFAAKYGTVPTVKTRYGGAQELSAPLQLFFYPVKGASCEAMPPALQQLMLPWLPAPIADTLHTLVLPAPLADGLQLAEREVGALSELRALLTGLAQGKLSLSAKTGMPSLALLRTLSAQLEEYYPQQPCEDAQGAQHIKAFGWLQLLRAASWVGAREGRLSLNVAGRSMLSLPLQEVAKQLWSDWLTQGPLDEFSRIETIKGQGGKGKAGLTRVADRRLQCARAFAQCPVGEWVDFATFSRFVLCAGFQFEITVDPWALYICDAHYGSLGYQGFDWNLMQGRYLRCLLLEYAATLGMVDLVYRSPQGALDDFQHTWGGQDLDCLSRYDGLVYFRLTPLGAYVLGLTPGYAAAEESAVTALSVRQDHRLAFTAVPQPAECLLLEQHAQMLSATVWQLSQDKILSLLEAGGDMQALREFIDRRDPQPYLPPATERLLTQCAARAGAGQGRCGHRRTAGVAADLSGRRDGRGDCDPSAVSGLGPDGGSSAAAYSRA
jgi:hypothetical protein